MEARGGGQTEPLGKHGEALETALKTLGVPVRRQAKDLGADAAPGIRRVRQQRARIGKGVVRARRLANVPLRPGRKAVHVRSLAVPVATYGVEIMGVAKTARLKLREAATAALCASP